MRALSFIPLLMVAAGISVAAAERIKRVPANPPQKEATGPFEITSTELALTDCPFEPGCPALILLDELVLDNTFDHAQLRHRRVTKLFTQESVAHYSDIAIRDDGARWIVPAVKGRTILPDGTVIPVGKENIFLKEILRWQGRGLLRQKTVKFPGIVPGAIVDCSWTEATSQPAVLSSLDWGVQREVPVLRAALTITQGEVKFEGIDVGLQRFKVNFTNPRGTGHFVASNIPALKPEPQAPPSKLLLFGVYFFLGGFEKEWLGEVAGINAGEAGAFIQKAPGVAARVSELVAIGDAPLTKTQKIYRFVQEQIGTEEARGESGYGEKARKLVDADEILRRRFGNEKERTYLFLAMVKEAGLESALLLVASRDHAILDTQVPDRDQFDAMAAAVRIGADWIYCDPGTKHLPFGMIAPESENPGANALLITPRKGAGATREVFLGNVGMKRNEVEPYRLVSIPVSAASRNVLSREAKLELKEDGSVAVEVTETGTGLVDLDHRRRYELLDEEARRASLAEELKLSQPLAQLDTTSFDEVGSFEKPATIRYRFTTPGLVSAVGDRLIVTPSLFDSLRPQPFSSETRTAAVVFPHTQKTHQRVVIPIPEGYEARELPERQLIKEGPFVLATFYARELDSIVFTRHLEIDTVVWSAADYTRLRGFFIRVWEADRGFLVLTRKTD